ncbi:acyl-CoA thioesterase [Alicyclobacillus dauci]|uniref:Acyl-CoA thioesterase n=1 Tax=Alicyclobacillus dauci TaxID=1475485 RepID=A0ABY6Z6C9_9BACL|nr:thioesterase family protein [Alicyclobacillus dauci]WAH38073.1 acyl-CoA thioesterase [Alicyclobacillus dauci]
MFTRNLQVRFSECDGLGHVNNATYFNYMEDARIEVFRMFNPSLSLDKWNLIVASARCDFLAQVTYADHLTVYTWVSHIGNSSFTLDHAIANEQGTWVARGQAALIAFDYTTQKASPITPEVRAQLASHGAAPEGVPALR